MNITNRHLHHLDTFCSRMQTRKDGSVVVREYHCIRVTA